MHFFDLDYPQSVAPMLKRSDRQPEYQESWSESLKKWSNLLFFSCHNPDLSDDEHPMHGMLWKKPDFARLPQHHSLQMPTCMNYMPSEGATGRFCHAIESGFDLTHTLTSFKENYALRSLIIDTDDTTNDLYAYTTGQYIHTHLVHNLKCLQNPHQEDLANLSAALQHWAEFDANIHGYTYVSTKIINKTAH